MAIFFSCFLGELLGRQGPGRFPISKRGDSVLLGSAQGPAVCRKVYNVPIKFDQNTPTL